MSPSRRHSVSEKSVSSSQWTSPPRRNLHQGSRRESLSPIRTNLPEAVPKASTRPSASPYGTIASASTVDATPTHLDELSVVKQSASNFLDIATSKISQPKWKEGNQDFDNIDQKMTQKAPASIPTSQTCHVHDSPSQATTVSDNSKGISMTTK